MKTTRHRSFPQMRIRGTPSAFHDYVLHGNILTNLLSGKDDRLNLKRLQTM